MNGAGKCHLCGRYFDPVRVATVDGQKVHKLCGFRHREQVRRNRGKS